MLMIRGEQMQALHKDFDDRLIADMSAWLETLLPESVVADTAEERAGALRRRVAEALRLSRRCGLSAAGDHRSYLLVSAMLGWDFNTQPQYRWIEECLGNASLGTPGERMADVLQALQGQLASQGASPCTQT